LNSVEFGSPFFVWEKKLGFDLSSAEGDKGKSQNWDALYLFAQSKMGVGFDLSLTLSNSGNVIVG
jgi:hypothetical protein